MSDLAILAAQIVDIQNDRLHKQFIKITIHVPEEQSDLVAEAFGLPSYTRPVPVALARLDLAAIKENAKKPSPVPLNDPKAAATRKPVAPEKKLAQRIGILCSEPVFQKFLCWEFDYTSCDEEGAAGTVRDYCKVDSRADIKPGTIAADYWDALYSRYIGWRDEPDLVEAAE